MCRPLIALSLLAACSEPIGPGDFDAPDDRSRRFDLVRVMTWNIETIGAPGSLEYNAALEVLDRLQPKIVALNEVASQNDGLYADQLAADAGYIDVAKGFPAAFGADHTVIFSKKPFIDVQVLDHEDLAGDPNAMDTTRPYLRVSIDTLGGPLTLLGNHLKCCSGNDEEFRRSVEATRGVQAFADLDPATDHVIVLGDLNEDRDDLPLSPAVFTSVPAGVPGSYVLGQDLVAVLNGPGLVNDPFGPFEDAGLTHIDALRRTGDNSTVLSGPDELDHIYLSPTMHVLGHEIYDSVDEGLPSNLHLTTPNLAPGTLADAADHRPVIVELQILKLN